MKKVYLAGKVTGLNLAELSHKFGAQEVKLMRMGFEVVNPLNIVPTKTDWHNAMRICIAALVACDEAYFMPCYKESKGALIEHNLCHQLGIPVIYL